MNVTIIKTIPAGQVGFGEASTLGRALSAATASNAVVQRLEYGMALDGTVDEATDRLTLLFDSAPNDATVDATIAAHPAVAAPVSGAFAVVSSTPYRVFEEVILIGEHVVYDVHIFAALGDIDDSQPHWIDSYPVVWRNSTGNVKYINDAIMDVGRIPGLQFLLTGTADTIQIELVMRKAGTLTLFETDVTRKTVGVLT